MMAVMDLGRFRRVVDHRWSGVSALGLGVFWLAFWVLPMLGDDDYSSDELTLRYVERELTLLESGEGKGWLIQWLTGRHREAESIEEMVMLMEDVWLGNDAAIIRGHLAEISALGGEAVDDYSLPQDQDALLRRFLMVGGLLLACVVGMVVVLFTERATLWKAGPVWRITRCWSPFWVLTLFFLITILVDLFLQPLLQVLFLIGGENWGYFLFTSLWRIAPAMFAAFVLVGSWSGVRRIFLGKDRISWKAVLVAFGALTLLSIVLQELALDGGEVDPSDFLWSVDPNGREIFQDVVSGVILAPVFEELMFRGVLFLGLMKRLGTPAAAFVSSVLFAIVHTQYDAWGIASVGVFGLACCWLTWKTGSIKSSIALHMIYNGAITLNVYLIYQMPLA